MTGAQNPEPASNQENNRRLGLVLFLCWLSTAILAMATFGLGVPKLSFIGLLCLQLACAAVVWFVATPADKALRSRSGEAALGAIWISIGGIYGAATATLVLAAKLIGLAKKPATTRQGLPSYEEPQARSAELYHALQDGRVRIEGAHETIPLADIFRFGSQTEKISGLAILARNYTPDLAHALHIPLNDRDSAVRVLATSILTALDASYTKPIKDAQTRKDSEGRLALANAHTAYAASGLIKADAQRGERTKALKAASDAYDLNDPKTLEQSRLLIASSLTELGRFDEAREFLKEPFNQHLLQAEADHLRNIAMIYVPTRAAGSMAR